MSSLFMLIFGIFFINFILPASSSLSSSISAAVKSTPNHAGIIWQNHDYYDIIQHHNLNVSIQNDDETHYDWYESSSIDEVDDPGDDDGGLIIDPAFYHNHVNDTPSDIVIAMEKSEIDDKSYVEDTSYAEEDVVDEILINNFSGDDADNNDTSLEGNNIVMKSKKSPLVINKQNFVNKHSNGGGITASVCFTGQRIMTTTTTSTTTTSTTPMLTSPTLVSFFDVRQSLRCSAGSSFPIGSLVNNSYICAKRCLANNTCIGFNVRLRDGLCIARSNGCVEVSDKFFAFFERNFTRQQIYSQVQRDKEKSQSPPKKHVTVSMAPSFESLGKICLKINPAWVSYRELVTVTMSLTNNTCPNMTVSKLNTASKDGSDYYSCVWGMNQTKCRFSTSSQEQRPVVSMDYLGRWLKITQASPSTINGEYRVECAQSASPVVFYPRVTVGVHPTVLSVDMMIDTKLGENRSLSLKRQQSPYGANFPDMFVLPSVGDNKNDTTRQMVVKLSITDVITLSVIAGVGLDPMASRKATSKNNFTLEMVESNLLLVNKILEPVKNSDFDDDNSSSTPIPGFPKAVRKKYRLSALSLANGGVCELSTTVVARLSLQPASATTNFLYGKQHRLDEDRLLVSLSFDFGAIVTGIKLEIRHLSPEEAKDLKGMAAASIDFSHPDSSCNCVFTCQTTSCPAVSSSNSQRWLQYEWSFHDSALPPAYVMGHGIVDSDGSGIFVADAGTCRQLVDRSLTMSKTNSNKEMMISCRAISNKSPSQKRQISERHESFKKLVTDAANTNVIGSLCLHPVSSLPSPVVDTKMIGGKVEITDDTAMPVLTVTKQITKATTATTIKTKTKTMPTKSKATSTTTSTTSTTTTTTSTQRTTTSTSTTTTTSTTKPTTTIATTKPLDRRIVVSSTIFTVEPAWLEYYSNLATVKANLLSLHITPCYNVSMYAAAVNEIIRNTGGDLLEDAKNNNYVHCIFGNTCKNLNEESASSDLKSLAAMFAKNAVVDQKGRWLQFRNISYLANGNYLFKCQNSEASLLSKLQIGVKPKILGVQVEVLPLEGSDGSNSNRKPTGDEALTLDYDDKFSFNIYPVRTFRNDRPIRLASSIAPKSTGNNTQLAANNQLRNFQLLVTVGKGFDPLTTSKTLGSSEFIILGNNYDGGTNDRLADARPTLETSLVSYNYPEIVQYRYRFNSSALARLNLCDISATGLARMMPSNKIDEARFEFKLVYDPIVTHISAKVAYAPSSVCTAALGRVITSPVSVLFSSSGASRNEPSPLCCVTLTCHIAACPSPSGLVQIYEWQFFDANNDINNKAAVTFRGNVVNSPSQLMFNSSICPPLSLAADRWKDHFASMSNFKVSCRIIIPTAASFNNNNNEDRDELLSNEQTGSPALEMSLVDILRSSVVDTATHSRYRQPRN